MTFQRMIFTLSLSLSSFLCMGMHPYHNAYALSFAQASEDRQNQLLQAQHQYLMYTHLHQEQLRRNQWEACLIQNIISVQKRMNETRQLLYPMYINSLLEHGCQCPNVMKDTTSTDKPSKVLEIVKRRDQQSFKS